MADITLSDAESLAPPPPFLLPSPGAHGASAAARPARLAQADEFPCPVVRVGKRYRVNRAALYAALDFDPVVAAQRLAAAAASTRPRAASQLEHVLGEVQRTVSVRLPYEPAQANPPYPHHRRSLPMPQPSPSRSCPRRLHRLLSP